MIRFIAPKLYSYQKAIGDSKKRFTATEACTKIGKTYYHIWWQDMQTVGKNQNGLTYKEVKEGDNHWWIAPSVNQAKIAFNRVRRRVQNISSYKINKSDRIITNSLGAEWHFKTGDDPESLYGENVYSVVMDEATRMKKEAFDAIYSTTTSTNAEVKLIGNVKGSCHWFNAIKKKAIKGDPDWEYFNINCYDGIKAGRLTIEQVELAQRNLDEATFSELYLAVQIEGENQVAKSAKIEEVWINKRVGYRDYMTCDIAFEGADLFVIGIWKGWDLTHVYTIEKSKPDEVVSIIKDYATIHNISASNICYDGDGIGMYLSGYLKNSINYKAGGAPQKEIGQKHREKLSYKNIDSQVLYLLATYINDNKMSCSAILDPETIERIIYEIKFIRTKETAIGDKIQCLSSTEIKKIYDNTSPDYLVMLKLRVMFELGNNSSAGYVID